MSAFFSETLLIKEMRQLKSMQKYYITTNSYNAIKFDAINFPKHENASVFWNVIIRKHVAQKSFWEAIGVFKSMREAGVLPDNYTFPIILKVCTSIGSLNHGKGIHKHAIVSGLVGDLYVANALMTMYAKCGDLVGAHNVFEGMRIRDVVSWNVMIGNSHGHDGMRILVNMQQQGIEPDKVSFVSVLPCCGDVSKGKQVHGCVIKRGFENDQVVSNAIIDMYSKCKDMKSAELVFDAMPERDHFSWNSMIAGYTHNADCGKAEAVFKQMRLSGFELNVVAWTALITGFAQNGYGCKSFEAFHEMVMNNVVPNYLTILSVLSACAHEEALWKGKEIHGYAISRFLLAHDLVQSAIIDMYSKCKCIDEAKKVFDNLSHDNATVWAAMICGFAYNECFEQALRFFYQMQELALKPSPSTIVSILPICGRIATSYLGKEIHAYIVRNFTETNIILINALIDVYSKCGNLDLARIIFDRAPNRNIVTWTAMIAGYGVHGFGEEALLFFSRMQVANIKPDSVTFIAVLSACSHSGLVNEGWRYFNDMVKKYSINPRMEHYACMVDLLGRAGMLNKAWDFIDKMPFEPQVNVWVPLLSACRIHGSIELGEVVANRISSLESENSGPYILLAQMYSEAGRWDMVEKMRALIKKQQLKKKPGCSWIEVNTKSHIFYASDVSHPDMERIYTLLNSLVSKMKEAGYVPDTRLSFPNTVEEGRDLFLTD